MAERVEARTQALGRELWDQLERRRPSLFDRRWWDEQILEWAMADESVKVQMFRFVDVLPMLKTHESVTRHLTEYFDEVRSHLPWAVRLGLDVTQHNSLLGKALALNARTNVRRMSDRFLAGTTVEDVMVSLNRIRRLGLAFTLDLLGEATISDREADQYQKSYFTLITGLAPQVNRWTENQQTDCDQFGPIPRVNVSLKFSALCSHFRPIDPEGTAAEVKRRLRPILQAARQCDAYVHVDIEQYAYKELTFDIFEQIVMEDAFRDWPDIGIAVQAYQHEAADDLNRLLELSRKRGTPFWIRLVKGAYWDYETLNAKQKGWPIPVFQEKWQSDQNFEQLTQFLFEHYTELRPMIASHNLRSLSHALACAEELNVPNLAWEIQMLYGMADNQAQLLSERGSRVRIYTPFGEILPGMAYLVRRLLENTSNDSFLRHTYDRDMSIETLLQAPQPTT